MHAHFLRGIEDVVTNAVKKKKEGETAQVLGTVLGQKFLGLVKITSFSEQQSLPDVYFVYPWFCTFLLFQTLHQRELEVSVVGKISRLMKQQNRGSIS
mmetsp:Transcript_36263/g.41306  ORF Transcript_36263/g.41306 Transcript_36263/m.41306 type:complete len:98 (-) Transcript_36263:211-504(-)